MRLSRGKGQDGVEINGGGWYRRGNGRGKGAIFVGGGLVMGIYDNRSNEEM